jgi:hypothetical protein
MPQNRYPEPPEEVAEIEEPRPKAVKSNTDIKADLEAFKHEMRGMMLATKAKRSSKKVIVEEESSSDDDEPVIVKTKRKTKPTREASPSMPPDNTEFLRSIFYRNY